MISDNIKNKTICVVGLGYVGTPLAEAFSQYLSTIGYDIDQNKVDLLINSGSKIKATTDPTEIKKADVIMICVPTPVTKAKDPDLFFVKSAAKRLEKISNQE